MRNHIYYSILVILSLSISHLQAASTAVGAPTLILLQLALADASPDIAMVKPLLNQGANPNYRATLYQKMYKGHKMHDGVVQLVEDNLTEISETKPYAKHKGTYTFTYQVEKVGSGDTAFMLFLKHNNPNKDVLLTLIDNGANINVVDANGLPAIWYARDADVIDSLVKHGADVSFKDKNGTSIIMHAVDVLVPASVIQKLLDNKADPNIQDNKGGTALMHAVDRKSTDSVTTLLTSGALVDLVNKDGETALIRAVKQQAPIGLIQALIDAKANLDIQDNTGSTALMYAADNNALAVVKALAQANANPNIMDKNNRNALGRAYAKGNSAIIAVLKPLTQE